jgi:hypothetical protein
LPPVADVKEEVDEEIEKVIEKEDEGNENIAEPEFKNEALE